MSLQFRHKIILLSASILFISIAAFAINNYFYLAGETDKQLQASLNEVGKAVSGNISNWMNAKLDTVKSVARRAASETDNATLKIITDQGAAFKEMPDVYVGLDNGTMIMNNPTYVQPSDYDPRKRPWYIKANQEGRGVFTAPYIDADSRKLVITAAMPFSGSSRGVAGGDLFLNVITDLVNSINFFDMGYAFLVSEDGTILVHPEQEWVDKRLSDLFKGSKVSMSQELTNAAIDGQNVLVGFVPIQGVESVNWNLAIVVDKDKAYASLYSFRNSALIFTIVGVAIVIGLMTLLLNSLMKPVVKLADTMQDIAQGEGDLTQRLDVHGNDEFAKLASGFNGFASKVQELVADIKNSVQSMAGSVNEMNQFASDTSDAVAMQRQETEMVATAVNEMSAAAREIAQNAQQAAEAAQKADEESVNVQTVVDDAIKSIAKLSEQIGEASEVINALEGDVNSIVSVLSVIRGIAEQTNLLALNAAIEAARAGEAGRGFAVVADEVRALASKTQESTEEIQAMISRLQDGSNRAVSSMEQSRANGESAVGKAQSAGESLTVITNSIGTISSMNTQIASASEEQTAVTEDISRSITSIADASEQTARGTEQTAQTSHELSNLGEHLREQVARFKV
ncbi:chemotaxis protein [Hahella sp. CCB-MM4]|uniref:methyl-accepting chemotaxis protein n=1 Tax=Hahella sp. (strain CCB-MM4) TaxID=1926491 RepID=UPI000BC753C9|nr:methyl-accepting chemotaxis protein [Hahella sp. CCB-MM4]OZG72511.1 chemotaxis protein [Hahella sp. CCB-MM4]